MCFILIVLVACVAYSGCCRDGMPNTDTHNDNNKTKAIKVNHAQPLLGIQNKSHGMPNTDTHNDNNKIKTVKVNHAQYLLGILNKSYGGAGLLKPKKDFANEDFRDIANHILSGTYKPEEYFAKLDTMEQIQLMKDDYDYVGTEKIEVFQIDIFYFQPCGIMPGGTVYTDAFYMILAAHNFKDSAKPYMLPYAKSYGDMCEIRGKIISSVQSGKYEMSKYFAVSNDPMNKKRPEFVLTKTCKNDFRHRPGIGCESIYLELPPPDRPGLYMVALYMSREK